MSQITRKGFTALLPVLILMMIAGCSSSNSKSSFDSGTGEHSVADWANPDVHGAWAKQSSSEGGLASCQECHGEDFSGGISQKACSSCHVVNAPHPQNWTTGTRKHSTTDESNAAVCAVCHTDGANSPIQPSAQPLPGSAPGCFNNTLCHDQNMGHAAGWASPDVHGASVKSQANGFSSCKTCHGSDYSGGSASIACSSCHGVNAPHPPTPWLNTSPTSTRTHTTTNVGNASVCADCHAGGANLTSLPTPTPPPPAGTPAGCFNNTLCHAQVGHPVGWASPGVHGASVKSQADGFSSCKTCHGSDYSGGSAGIACSSCHGVNAPHPPKPWIASLTSAYTHTTTDQGNASVCADCHTNGANLTSLPAPNPPAPAGTPAGCFNNTLCHAQIGHPAGWSVPGAHGAAAKSAPSTTQGFSYCQNCHGLDFTGPTTTGSCTNNCHVDGTNTPVNAPHAFPWTSTSTYKHSETSEQNAPICALCHLDELTNGVGSRTYQPLPVGTTINGCFDGRLCHDATSIGCVDCHSSAQAGTHGTPRDAVVGEFGLAYGHKNSSRGAVTNADCIVCHLEGDSATQARSTTYHGDGNIDLRDPDGAGETPITDLSGAAFTFTKFSMSFAAGSRTSSPAASSIPDVISQKFCVACHDSDGATNPTARADDGGTATQYMPFGGINLGANYTVANGAAAAGGLVDVKTEFATTNSSYHPVLGPLNRDFPQSSLLAAPYDNNGRTTATSGTKTNSVVINCFDCHNVSGASPLTTRTVSAHGNAEWLRGTVYATEPTLCTTCHVGYYSTTRASVHGTGSGFASGGSSHRTNENCHYCHGSNTGTTRPARPLGAQDYHGNNALVGGGLWPTINSRPYAFIRGWSGTAYHRPYRSTEFTTGNATCGRGTCPGGGQVGDGSNRTYTPGGSY